MSNFLTSLLEIRRGIKTNSDYRYLTQFPIQKINILS
jgi:hypothetical protein